jgi:hypothetical protein
MENNKVYTHALLEAISEIASPTKPILNTEASDKPVSDYQGLMDQIQSSFLKYFPNGFFKAYHSTNIANSIHIRVGLIGDISDVSGKIAGNDPMFTSITIFIEDDGSFRVSSHSSGLSINPEEGSHMAMGTVRNPVRKFATDKPEVIVGKLDQYFAKCKDIVKTNWDNIYRVQDIDPKYMAESAIQESSNSEVSISHEELLQASSVISKYPNDIRVKVKGKNKFALELYNKSLLDKDKNVAKLFGKSVNESLSIQEDGEEVFKSDNGKIISSLKDGKRVFTAFNSAGKIIGKPFPGKSVAVEAIKKCAT